MTQEFEPRHDMSVWHSRIRAAAVGMEMWEPEVKGRGRQAKGWEAGSGGSRMPGRGADRITGARGSG